MRGFGAGGVRGPRREFREFEYVAADPRALERADAIGRYVRAAMAGIFLGMVAIVLGWLAVVYVDDLLGWLLDLVFWVDGLGSNET